MTATKEWVDSVIKEIERLNKATSSLKKTNFKEGGGIIDTANLATGGIVYASRGFQPKGTDTVPAMLTPGEMVLTRDQQKALGGMGTLTININNPVVMNDDDIIERIGNPIMRVFKQHFATV